MPDWLLTMKPAFLAEWAALPQREALQIQKKLLVLTDDPKPDGKQKKRLQSLEGRLCRLRSGDYRVFYTFESPYVSLLGVRRRAEDTYDGVEGENLGGLDGGNAPVDGAPAAPAPRDWSAHLDTPATAVAARPLSQPITRELLERLRVPAEYHERLIRVTTEDELLAGGAAPDEVLLLIDQAIGAHPLEEVAQQPELVAQDANDLIRFRDGELLGFLLRLDPEQERFVTWGLKATGPTLLKGGPGTGKSTVGLYRARAMLAALRREGVTAPRLLFTTYTNALVRFSEQLLRSLLGEDARFVEVRTADSLVMSLAHEGHGELTIAPTDRQLKLLGEAVGRAAFAGNALVKRAQTVAIDRLGRDYLLQEINTVVDARRLTTLDEYLAAKRPGRQVPLNRTERTAVWCVAEAFHAALAQAGLHTWQQVRGLAAARVERGDGVAAYDGVIVDEAQDLEPAVLQVLVGLCRAPNRLFLTADANQSIYGGGFRWHDVHDSLRFQGRTGVLRANYRSTREIGEAAQGYLANGVIDDEEVERHYIHGGVLPAVRAVEDDAGEGALLARFIRAAVRELRLTVGSTAVLVPWEAAGQRIAADLTTLGVPAAFMKGTELDLQHPSVKVLTLKSAKGLEFPIVAIAGLDPSHPRVKPGATAEEREEVLARERRTLFVAMTRAMRALLVVVPSATESPLLTDFSSTLWNLGPQGQ